MDTFLKSLYNGLLPASKKGSLESVGDVLSNLKFIGMVEKGEKIDVKSLRIHTNSTLDSFWRTWFGENRTNTLDFLTTTVTRAFEILDYHLENNTSSSKTICKTVICDLVGSILGMINLKSTYNRDKKFLCQIQTLIQTIEVKLKDIRDKHEDIFPKNIKLDDLAESFEENNHHSITV